MAGRLNEQEPNLTTIRPEPFDSAQDRLVEGQESVHVSTSSTRTDSWTRHAAAVKRALATLALAFSALAGPPVWADAAPAMLLAEVYAANVDVTQYWVSEKFDGVRAQWDGHTLRFRGGGTVPAPAWFTANFPAVPLDGELWIGRGQFDALSGTVRKIEPVDAEWRQVRYLVFELPGAAGDFSERVRQMRAVVEQAAVPWLKAVEQTRVADRDELMKRLDAVVRTGGEGLMLHRADAPYLTSRSDALLKLKPWLDTEAVVVGYVPGKGKYQGMTGALQMEMPDGKRFRIGSGLSDALRREPPPIGTRITYRYQNLTKGGLPRFPRYMRIREDF
jgi:DNA ligase 1